MLDPDHSAPPFNPLPAVVILLCVAIGLVELALQAGASGLIGGPDAIGWRIDAIAKFAFFDNIFEWMLEHGVYPPQLLVRFVTYPFVHGGLGHAAFAVVMTLAIGKFVGEVFSAPAVLAVFFGSAIVGAFAYGMVFDSRTPLLGAFPAIYGLIGAFTYILWVIAKATDGDKWRPFAMIGFLMFFQLVFKALFGGGDDWVADLAGFATGFLLSFVLEPRGRARIMSWISVARRRN